MPNDTWQNTNDLPDFPDFPLQANQVTLGYSFTGEGQTGMVKIVTRRLSMRQQHSPLPTRWFMISTLRRVIR